MCRKYKPCAEQKNGGEGHDPGPPLFGSRWRTHWEPLSQVLVTIRRDDRGGASRSMATFRSLAPPALGAKLMVRRMSQPGDPRPPQPCKQREEKATDRRD